MQEFVLFIAAQRFALFECFLVLSVGHMRTHEMQEWKEKKAPRSRF